MQTSGEDSWCLARPEEYPPRHDRDRIQHDAGEVHCPTNDLVSLQPAGMIEQKGPVMLATADQRQFLGAGVSHIDGDVPAALPQPPERYRGTVAVAPTPQGHGEHGWHDELEEGSAQDGQDLTIEGEHQMTGFVNREVEAVDPTVGARGNQAKPAVRGQNHGEGGPPASFIGGIVQHGLQFSCSSQAETLPLEPTAPTR